MLLQVSDLLGSKYFAIVSFNDRVLLDPAEKAGRRDSVFLTESSLSLSAILIEVNKSMFELLVIPHGTVVCGHD